SRFLLLVFLVGRAPAGEGVKVLAESQNQAHGLVPSEAEVGVSNLALANSTEVNAPTLVSSKALFDSPPAVSSAHELPKATTDLSVKT
ncbi:unnamed protein product, partial [Ilex paraguariensis]